MWSNILRREIHLNLNKTETMIIQTKYLHWLVRQYHPLSSQDHTVHFKWSEKENAFDYYYLMRYIVSNLLDWTKQAWTNFNNPFETNLLRHLKIMVYLMTQLKSWTRARTMAGKAVDKRRIKCTRDMEYEPSTIWFSGRGSVGILAERDAY